MEQDAERLNDSPKYELTIDLSKCKGKGDCVKACSCNVLDIRELTTRERSSLGFLGKIKSLKHGYRKAFVAYAAECIGCNLCVKACSEKAIKLEEL